MSIADELRKLQELHSKGALSDKEFAEAKAMVLKGAPQPQGDARKDTALFPINPYEGLTPQSLRVMQLIGVSLLTGVVVFFGIVLYLVQVQRNGQGFIPLPQRNPDLPLLSLVAVAMSALCIPLSFVVTVQL